MSKYPCYINTDLNSTERFLLYRAVDFYTLQVFENGWRPCAGTLGDLEALVQRGEARKITEAELFLFTS